MGKLLGLSPKQSGLIHLVMVIFTGANCNFNNVLGNFLVKVIVQGLIRANTTPTVANILLSRWALLLYAITGSVWHFWRWVRQHTANPTSS